MAFKLGKYYLTRNNPRAILKYNAKLMDENYKLQQKMDKAINYISNINASKICNIFDPYLDDLLSILKEEEK